LEKYCAMTPTEVFARKASGLTRVISPWEALVYSTINPNLVGPYFLIVWIPGLFLGADVSTATLALVLMVPIMALYYLYSVAMPRSGGEYIYVSRSLSPVWGFFVNWVLTIIGFSWTANLVQFQVNWGIGHFFYANGLLNNNQSWINLGLELANSSGVLAFGVALVIVVLNYVLLWRGAKAVMRWNWIALTMAILSYVAVIFAGVTSTQQIFIQRLHDLAGVDYATILSQAKTQGANLTTVSMEATLMAGITYIGLNILGNTFTANVAGEVKQVSKAMPLALFGSLALMAIIWEIFYAAEWIFLPTKDWWNAIGYMTIAGTSPLPIFPMASTMPLYLTSNPIIINLAILGYTFGISGATVGLSFGPIRNTFAWSFDRLIPYSISKVDRRGSPYMSVLLGFVISVIFLVVFFFTTLMQFMLYSVTVWMVGWTVLGIAAMLLPYRRKDIFEKSPEVVRKRVAGVPLITILGLLTAIVSAFTVYFTAVPSLTGYMAWFGLFTTSIILIIVPFIVFYIAYYYRKRQGIPMELQFREIPPD